MFVVKLYAFNCETAREVNGYLCSVLLDRISGAHATLTGSVSDGSVLLFEDCKLAISVATFCLSSLFTCYGFDVVDCDSCNTVYSAGDYSMRSLLQGGKNE